MTTITTQRLVLRAFDERDIDFVFDLYSRWEVAQYLGAEPKVMQSREQAERSVARWVDDEGVWAITLHGEPIGLLLLKPIPVSAGEEDRGEIEIGWQLHPDVWGHGYATEAARNVVQQAFAAGVDRVVAIMYPQNSASRGVAQRLGMTFIGSSNRYYDTTGDIYEVRK